MNNQIIKIEDLIAAMSNEAKLGEIKTRKGVTTVVVGVTTGYKEALANNLRKIVKAKKTDGYAVQTDRVSFGVQGFEHAIVVRFAA